MVRTSVALLFIAGIALLEGCSRAPQETRDWEPRSFVCSERPLPEFTLGYDSDPSVSQVEALCDCIWEGLPDWAQLFSEAAASGGVDAGPYENPEWNVRAFSSKFGEQLEQCGGYSL